MNSPVRLVDIRDTALDIAEVLAAVSDPYAGGVTLFAGAVRDHDGGRQVEAIEYAEHPTALARLQEVSTLVAERYDATGVSAVHRVGRLEIGDLAVIVAVATAHRDRAFEASRALIDELKATVPIWKHQIFTDGTDEWVGTP